MTKSNCRPVLQSPMITGFQPSVENRSLILRRAQRVWRGFGPKRFHVAAGQSGRPLAANAVAMLVEKAASGSSVEVT